jgi:hypothetical protein
MASKRKQLIISDYPDKSCTFARRFEIIKDEHRRIEELLPFHKREFGINSFY